LRSVWILTAVIVFFGLANGLMINVTPQDALALGFSSADIGKIGVGIPVGYASSCLLLWRLSGRLHGKLVPLCGILGALATLVLMGLARTVNVCTAAQVGFGLASGAFWPFMSAWLLEFQSDGLGKQRLLRHYNVGWTTGASTGLFLAGVLCRHGLIQETLFGAAALLAAVFVAACCAKSGRGAQGAQGDRQPISKQPEIGVSPPAPCVSPPAAEAPHSRGIGLPLLVAAASVNMAALATRGMILYNYPELNQELGFLADRMGILTALTLVAQLAAFGFGSVYEPWLGLRRLYVFMAAALAAICLAFAYSSSLAVLVPAVLLHGLVLAVAFQTGIFAATSFFAVPRIGTTFHEATVGIAGVAVLAAGQLVAYLKDTGAEAVPALRAPFLLMIGVIVLTLVMQLVLVSLRNHQRVLLPAVKPRVNAHQRGEE